MTSRKKHIVFIGFMGSGKSTIGRILSEKLKMPFLDLDEYIEHQEGMKIKDIFNNQGENHFREIERSYLLEVLVSEKPTIISTGGGAPCFYDNMDRINNKGLSIYLKVGRQTLTNRLRDDNKRPLLQNKTEKELFTFVDSKLRERAGYYSQADFTVRGSDSPEEIVGRLIERKKKSK